MEKKNKTWRVFMWKIVLIAVLIVSLLTIVIELAASLSDHELIIPSVIKENTSMNWFGCWFCFILLGAVSPLLFIIKIFYILCHIGTKE